MRLETAKYMTDPLLPVPYIVRSVERRDPYRSLWFRVRCFLARLAR